MSDRTLLIRYLRQRKDLGERELFFDSLPASQAIALVQGRAAAVASGSPAAPSVARLPVLSAGATPARPDGGWETLERAASGCTACPLHASRRSVVFGEGSREADVVVVGEAPGAEEDRTGRPFVGPAGKLLDLMLASVGYPRDSVFICNVLKCRPPNNRDPQPAEVECCSVHLHRQIELIEPRALLAVGKFAAQTLLGTDASIGKLRGTVGSYRGVPVIPTYHPAFLLRSPQWIRAAWQDLQLLRKVVHEQS